MQELPRSISPYRRMVVNDLKRNMGREDVVLNMDDASTSSESSSDSQIEEVEEEEEDDDDTGDLHCDDWEIKMLAAELNRRESRKEDLTSETISEADEEGSLLRRRRKRSDTDTECSSEIETELLARPRAASLDQHNPRRSTPKLRGVFKAMSFDRDKDRL